MLYSNMAPPGLKWRRCSETMQTTVWLKLHCFLQRLLVSQLSVFPAGTVNTALRSASRWWPAVVVQMGNFPDAFMTRWSGRAWRSNREAPQTRRRKGAETTAWAAAAYRLSALFWSRRPTLSPKQSRLSATPTVCTGWVQHNTWTSTTLILSVNNVHWKTVKDPDRDEPFCWNGNGLYRQSHQTPFAETVILSDYLTTLFKIKLTEFTLFVFPLLQQSPALS